VLETVGGHGGNWFHTVGSYSYAPVATYAAPVVAYSAPVVVAQAPASSREQAMEAELRRLRDEIRKLKGEKPRKPDDNEATEPASAHVVVKLPETARLYIDNTICPLTSATRAFDTPTLKPGQAYAYTLRAEVNRAGKPITESKRVIVRAGEETVVEFSDLQTVQTAGR